MFNNLNKYLSSNILFPNERLHFSVRGVLDLSSIKITEFFLSVIQKTFYSQSKIDLTCPMEV